VSGQTVIIGAGPAGLTAAYELARVGRPVVVLEQDPSYVGGIARTVSYKGFRFDIGGHRFFSKNPAIEQLWTTVLGDQMMERERLSRIYYRGRFFKYPLESLDVLRQLGLYEAAACVISYFAARMRPRRPLVSFEDWVTNAFGRRLFAIFFRSYTEKVWGIPCSQISADWAAQRIKDLSMRTLLANALSLRSRNRPVIKTLINRFRYPAHGPGQMWDKIAAQLRDLGVTIQMAEQVTSIERNASGMASVATIGPRGHQSYRAEHFISTMPIRDLIGSLDPPAPSEVARAARSLKYRDFIVVSLIVDSPDLFPDQWIYIHEASVKVGRIQNFKNWSPAMVPDPRYTVLGLEYFCFKHDPMWQMNDTALIKLAKDELGRLGLADPSFIVDGTVVRQPAAYPVYDANYAAAVSVVRDFIEREIPNLQLAGRNGMHKYNNQDHAMLTGLMAARNIMGASYDLWRVNADALYLEEGEDEADGGRLYPQSLPAPSLKANPHTA
jgi:protoporphyrinogen oxidase